MPGLRILLSAALGAGVLLCGAAHEVVSAARQDSMAQTPQVQSRPPSLAHGTHERSITVGERTRKYRVYLPRSVDLERPAPVVLAFHGGGGNPDSMIRLCGLNGSADRHGFIVVYPYGSARFGERRLTFNAGNVGGYAMQQNIDDVGFTRALLDDLAGVTQIDQDRVFATGMSNGAMMAYRLASELADRIAAVAPVGGPMGTADCRPVRPVPVMHFHGTADTLAPFRGGFGVLPDGGKGVTDFFSVDHSIGKWIEANKCMPTPKIETLPDSAQDGTSVIMKTWSGGENNSEVILVEITGGGHTWPGEAPVAGFLGLSTRDISANDMMWQFFQRHPRRAAAVREGPAPDVPATKPRTPGWVTPAIRAPRVEHRMFESAAAGTSVSFHIYLPKAYAEQPERKFPVLYWLHGTGGGLAGIGPLARWFDAAIEEGKVSPLIVVFPNGLATSMWCDSKDGSVPMETVVVKELVPHVDSTFRTISDRRGRVIEGFSMGGYGAARLGLKHPDVFGAVSCLAGGPLDIEFRGPRTRENPRERDHILATTFGNDLEYFREQSPLTVAERYAAKPTPGVALRIAVGSQDFTAELNRAFAARLEQLGVANRLTIVPEAGHDTLALLRGLGAENWEFYRSAFAKTEVEDARPPNAAP